MNASTPLLAALDNAATSRRHQRKASIEGSLVELRRRYESQIAAGEDAAADKTSASIAKAEADLRSAELALDTATRLDELQAEQERRTEQERHLRDYLAAVERLRAESVRFEELVQGPLLAHWRTVCTLDDEVTAAAKRAGVSRGATGVPPLMHTWSRIWLRYMQQAVKEDILFEWPSGRSPSRALPSVAESWKAGIPPTETAADKPPH